MVNRVTCSGVTSYNQKFDLVFYKEISDAQRKILKFFGALCSIRIVSLVCQENRSFVWQKFPYLQKHGKPANTAVKQAYRTVFLKIHQKNESQRPSTANIIWASKNRKTILGSSHPLC